MTQTEYYIGLMSGTSLDGIDAALIEIESDAEQMRSMHLKASRFLPFNTEFQQRLGALCSGSDVRLLELGQISVELALQSASLIKSLLNDTQLSSQDIRAIGCHGVTIAHHPELRGPFSMQITDASYLAAKTGIDVVSDFRMADMAVGGQGAPLVPPFHQAIVPTDIDSAAVLNLGGIANVTVLEPNVPLVGFDTGPANTLLNLWCQLHTGETYDRNGDWGASGECHAELLRTLLADPYFSQRPPKSTGKERFNLEWLEAKLAAISDTEVPANDVQCTLTHLTAETIAQQLNVRDAIANVYVCGGGVHNAFLMQCLQSAMPNKSVTSTLALGVCPDNMEAMAFAWLASCRVHLWRGNRSSVTGALSERVLGAWYHK